MTTAGILAAYWVGALLCGAALGVLRPITRTRLGAFFLGWLVASVAYGSAVLLLPDAEWWIAPFLGLVGGGMGVVWHDEDFRPKPEAAIGPVVRALAVLTAFVALVTLVAGG